MIWHHEYVSLVLTVIFSPMTQRTLGAHLESVGIRIKTMTVNKLHLSCCWFHDCAEVVLELEPRGNLPRQKRLGDFFVCLFCMSGQDKHKAHCSSQRCKLDNLFPLKSWPAKWEQSETLFDSIIVSLLFLPVGIETRGAEGGGGWEGLVMADETVICRRKNSFFNYENGPGVFVASVVRKSLDELDQTNYCCLHFMCYFPSPLGQTHACLCLCILSHVKCYVSIVNSVWIFGGFPTFTLTPLLRRTLKLVTSDRRDGLQWWPCSSTCRHIIMQIPLGLSKGRGPV